MSGYVRIHRPLFEEHPAFRNDSEALAFAWMIAKAQWQAKCVRYKGHKLSLERGQIAISQRDMARALGRDKAWVERLWRRLRSEAMIEMTGEAGVAVVTICNYAQYQADIGGREAPDEAPEKADARQTRGTEQIREEGKEVSSEAKASSLRPWALPVGVNLQVWSDFLANRKRKRLGNSPTAWKAFNDDLVRISVQTGIPPPLLIEQCTAKGWGAIYDPRDQRNERSDTNPTGTAVQRILSSL